MLKGFSMPRMKYRSLGAVLVLGVFPLAVGAFGRSAPAAADDGNEGAPRVVVKLPPSPDNPRNSEGDFIRLRDGRVMFVYTHFRAGASDHDPAHLAARFSSDGGRTWTQADVEVLPNEGDWNVMSVSLLRLHSGDIGLFYLRKNSLADCRPYLRISRDEGGSWSEPVVCITDEVAYYVMNNDRAVQLADGRLVLPVALHAHLDGDRMDWHGRVMCYLSDDQGKTWQRSRGVLTGVDPTGKRLLAQEPGVVELADGRLLLFCRSDAGCQLISYSDDRGDTWTQLEESAIRSPVSPASIERIPGSDDLLMVWNNHQSIPPDQAGLRTPLTAAISRDHGQTWASVKNLADNPHGWYCYTALEITDDGVLLGHCAGDRRENNGLAETHITRFTLGWLTR